MAAKIKQTYQVVECPYIHDDRCFRPLADDVDDPYVPLTASEINHREERLRAELEELFLQAGWEGDGQVQCFFVPPCFGNHGDEEDAECITIYHVRQRSNGKSWLAIPKGFEFRMPRSWRRKQARQETAVELN